MISYQDFLQVPDNDLERARFVRTAISDYCSGSVFKTAQLADEYDRCRNRTAMQYQKMITDLTGKQYVDYTAVVHRSTSNFYNIITTQINQYLLGNGVTWKGNPNLGNDADTRIQQAGKLALTHGVSYGFWNKDRIAVFSALEYFPLLDEEDGAGKAGVRFWQIDSSRPLRATLYELDGFTEFLFTTKEKAVDPKWTRLDEDVFMLPKRAYQIRIVGDAKDLEDGTAKIYAGESYPTFPIIPLYANPRKQAEIVGMQEKIDAYDFILNGWEDDLDNAQIYWIIKGAGGMDDPDLRRFLDRLRTIKAAAPEDGQEVQPVTVNIPVEAREELLTRLEKQIYRDAMCMNPEDLASSAATATQIRAAYERQNVKTDQFEYCVIEFLRGILAVAGLEDKPTFTRSTIVNTQEEVQTVVMAAQYLSDEYVTQKILTLLGDGDKAEDMIKQLAADNIDRLGNVEPEGEENLNE